MSTHNAGRRTAPTTRSRAGAGLLALGVLLFSIGVMMIGAPAAVAAEDTTTTTAQHQPITFCHAEPASGPAPNGRSYSILTTDDDGTGVPVGHGGHDYDVIPGMYSDSLGRTATAEDVQQYCGEGSTTTTQAPTTTVGGPCDPNTETCLPNTGGDGGVVWVALTALGALFAGVGLVVMAYEQRRGAFARR
jgi:hypothetical protein